MTDPRAIQEQTRLYVRLKESLLAQFPDLADDQQALLDTLEGESSLPDMLAAVERSRQDDEEQITGIKVRLEALNARLARYLHHSDGLRKVLRIAMEQAGLDKIVEPDFTISLRQVPRKLVITDEKLLPKKYTEQTTKILKSLITSDLRSNVVIPGAQLDNGGQTVNIRTK